MNFRTGRVPAGEHELTVANLVYPAAWTRPFTPTIAGAAQSRRTINPAGRE